MAEQQRLSKDLQEVLKEMSKAPGGNVASPRPVTPGPILGGPPVEPKPGVVDPATGVRSRRDPAIELFRFYAYGEEKPSRIPPPPPDTKTVTKRKFYMTSDEQLEAEARKEAGLPVKQTALRRQKNKAIRQGTVGGMTRPIGSKPPVHLAKNLPIAIEVATERAQRRTDAEIIRAALEKAFGAIGSEAPEFKGKYTPELNPTAPISREEQKYLDYLQRRIQDAVLEREAAVAEELAARGQTTPTLEEVRAMQEAERRTLEGRQVAERTRLSRQAVEQSVRGLPEKNVIKVEGGNQGKGTPLGDAKDVQMRKISNAAIVELVDIETQNKIKNAIPNAVGKTSSETSLLQLGPADNNLSGKTIMLARNGKLSGKPLRPETIAQITNAARAGANFVVGDMPGVDSQFIDLLDKLKAPYKIYHTGNEPRIKIKSIATESKLPILGGKALGALGAVGTGLDAFFMYKIMLAQAAAEKKQIQSNLMN